MKILTSREFNQDVSFAKRAARIEPVIVTDRGQPTHVLLSIEAFRRYSGEQESIVDMLAMKSVASGRDAEPTLDDANGPWDHEVAAD